MYHSLVRDPYVVEKEITEKILMLCEKLGPTFSYRDIMMLPVDEVDRLIKVKDEIYKKQMETMNNSNIDYLRNSLNNSSITNIFNR